MEYSLNRLEGTRLTTEFQNENKDKQLVQTINQIVEAGNQVQVNDELVFDKASKDLIEDYIIKRQLIVCRYTYFSNTNNTNFNGKLTTSEELNEFIIKTTIPLHYEIKFLFLLIKKESDKYKRDSLEIIYKSNQEEYELALSYIKSHDVCFFICKHLALARTIGMLNFEAKDKLKSFDTEVSSELQLNNLKKIYDMLDGEFRGIYKYIHSINIKNFDKNMTIADLINCQHYFNIKGIYELDAYIENILKIVENQTITTKLADLGLGYSKMRAITLSFDNNKDQVTKRFFKLLCFNNSLHPILNKYFQGQYGYCYSSYSIDTFINFMRETCKEFYSKPINHEEKFIIITLNHAMSIEIKRKEEGVIIEFFNPSCGFRAYIITITDVEYVNALNIFTFLPIKLLIQYDILLGNSYDLSTIKCIKVCK